MKSSPFIHFAMIFSDIYRYSGTLQCGFVHPYNSGTLRLCFPGWQSSHLRHMSLEPKHCSTYIHEFESINCTNYFLDHRFFEIWRSAERWLEWIPNQFGALSKNSLSTSNICSCNIRRKGKSIFIYSACTLAMVWCYRVYHSEHVLFRGVLQSPLMAKIKNPWCFCNLQIWDNYLNSFLHVQNLQKIFECNF